VYLLQLQERAREAASDIMDRQVRQPRLVDDLLDVSRVTRGKIGCSAASSN
jgi:hypothetical protein